MHRVVNTIFLWIIAVLATTSSINAMEQKECLVGDIFYLNGDSIGYSGLECVDESSFDAMISTCVQGTIVNSFAIMKCDAKVPYCVQCGLRGKGAAHCLNSPDDSCIKIDQRSQGKITTRASAYGVQSSGSVIMGSGGMSAMGPKGMGGNIGLDAMIGLDGKMMGESDTGGRSAKGMGGNIGLYVMTNGPNGEMNMGGMMMGMGGMMMMGGMGGMGSTKVISGDIYSHEQTVLSGGEKGKKHIRKLQTSASALHSKQIRGSSISV